jgi:heme exporter protein CcmD
MLAGEDLFVSLSYGASALVVGALILRAVLAARAARARVAALEQAQGAEPRP